MPRPASLHSVAVFARDAPFDALLREFLDGYYETPEDGRAARLSQEPPPLSARPDAYLAAVAEHLSLCDARIAPDWTEEPSRFLKHPMFAGGLESLKPLLFVQSPLAFRRRQIFVSADALSRPRDSAARMDTP